MTIDYSLNVRFDRLEKQVSNLAERLEIVLDKMKPEQDIWDNSDMIRKWKVSQRTLATWRSKNLIGYGKAGSKIFYTPEDRSNFLSKNHIKNVN